MSTPVFVTAGPVPPDSCVYVPRKADTEALARLRAMQYLSVVAPHQQGKTSLIGRLAFLLGQEGFITLYIGMGGLVSCKNQDEWYAKIIGNLLNDLRLHLGSDPADKLGSITPNPQNWLLFLEELSHLAFHQQKRLIIALDEAGATPENLATDFYSIIRSLYDKRIIHEWLYSLTFLIAGTFNPRELIQNNKVSEFNISNQISLEDFGLSQVEGLSARLPERQRSKQIGRCIHQWTDGQPYLVQKLCEQISLAENEIRQEKVAAVVNAVAKQLLESDQQHLPGIFENLESQPGMLDCLQALLQQRGEVTLNLNKDHFWLVKINGILADKSPARIRNRIYQEKYKSFLKKKPKSAPIPAAVTGNAPPEQKGAIVVNIGQAPGLAISPVVRQDIHAAAPGQAPDSAAIEKPHPHKEHSMDPISLIVTALVAGITEGLAGGLGKAAKQTVQKAVSHFRERLKGKVKDSEDAELALAQLEKDPASKARQGVLIEELNKLKMGEDADLVREAENVLTSLQAQGVNLEVYVTQIETAYGTVIGHPENVTQYWSEKPPRGNMPDA